jgi:hypothetical protein
VGGILELLLPSPIVPDFLDEASYLDVEVLHEEFPLAALPDKDATARNLVR